MQARQFTPVKCIQDLLECPVAVSVGCRRYSLPMLLQHQNTPIAEYICVG